MSYITGPQPSHFKRPPFCLLFSPFLKATNVVSSKLLGSLLSTRFYLVFVNSHEPVAPSKLLGSLLLTPFDLLSFESHELIVHRSCPGSLSFDRPAFSREPQTCSVIGTAQALPHSLAFAPLVTDDDEDEDENDDRSDEEYVAPPSPAPRPVAPAGPSPARTSRAESTVGLEDLSEFLRTCCQAKQTGHMTLHRVLWYTYLAWRQKIASPRPSVSSGGVGLSQCMQKLGHRERLFTREIQVGELESAKRSIVEFPMKILFVGLAGMFVRGWQLSACCFRCHLPACRRRGFVSP